MITIFNNLLTYLNLYIWCMINYLCQAMLLFCGENAVEILVSRAGLVNGSSSSVSSLRSATNTPKHIKVTVPHNADTTGKPPNVIVFSESSVSAESVKNTLHSVLHKHRSVPACAMNSSVAELVSIKFVEKFVCYELT